MNSSPFHALVHLSPLVGVLNGRYVVKDFISQHLLSENSANMSCTRTLLASHTNLILFERFWGFWLRFDVSKTNDPVSRALQKHSSFSSYFIFPLNTVNVYNTYQRGGQSRVEDEGSFGVWCYDCIFLQIMCMFDKFDLMINLKSKVWHDIFNNKNWMSIDIFIFF